MICETCKNSGRRGMVLKASGFPHFRDFWIPCLTCNGSGLVHCCEGDREQPEPKTNDQA
jgi:DnaJ-class molecular chaperone